ncbi:KasA/KasB family beta-ketoacyl-ACP synthase [Mycolicibacterium palauense]|uniref:KasA/KasB family beta-ketoacyl-ACP synthase n=1 Tax=Mycolicibacterium palauense TaxID=2034511 RepID=UPI000BFECE9D|nr:KasA/KasB family beta-ketoacyl-ACP synthase [Mycolicibacterium palauense]
MTTTRGASGTATRPALSTGHGLVDVVVTAVASTTPIAADAEETWQGLLDGHSGIDVLDYPFIEEFHLPVHIGGRLLEEFDEHLTRIELRRLSYMQKMSTVLGRRVWDNAGAPDVDTTRLLVSIGHAFGTTQDLVNLYDQWRARGMRAANPLMVQMHMPNAPAAAVGLDRHAKSGVVAPILADASGAAAIGQAWRMIALGEADIAICGGVETKIEATPVAAFANSGLLSCNNDDPAGACRPFDRDRDGTVLAEGGALMVVESEQHARARGATILARVMGFSMTSDGYDAVASDPSGETAADAITRAVRLAGLTAADIDCVKAHATGTSSGDVAETHAIQRALAHGPAVTAPKGALGQSMGASGAVEAVVTVQALRDGIVPPTVNLEHLDPEVDLDVVTGKARYGDYRYAVANSFGLGGQNVALVFGAA